MENSNLSRSQGLIYQSDSFYHVYEDSSMPCRWVCLFNLYFIGQMQLINGVIMAPEINTLISPRRESFVFKIVMQHSVKKTNCRDVQEKGRT